MAETLSQQEIDELLRQAMGDAGAAARAPDSPTGLSAIEMDALGEISNISMGAAATALHTILGRRVVITTPDVTVVPLSHVTDQHVVPYVMVDVEYASGFAGHNLFILQIDDVKAMTDVMMGGAGVAGDEELSELHLSAISEAMNQMMGGMATAMADMFNEPINITPPRTRVVTLTEENLSWILDDSQEEIVRVLFRLEIDRLLDSTIMQLMPVHFCRQLVERALGPIQAPPVVPLKARNETPGGEPVRTNPAAGPAKASPPPVRPAASQKAAPAEPRDEPEQKVTVRPIELTSFDRREPASSPLPESGINLILDVPLQITVELGQCQKSIRDILNLSLGSIITLDRLAGEPVDVVVNGKSLARGEVIVIDDNYGVRITEVFQNAHRFDL